jgi:hypothetical protein
VITSSVLETYVGLLAELAAQMHHPTPRELL